MDALERVELLAILDFFAAAPRDVADALDLAVLSVDDGAAFSIGADPKPLLFNRALGLENGARLDDVEGWCRSRGAPLVVSARPGSQLESDLRARSYHRSRTYMKFCREVGGLPEPHTPLTIQALTPEHADDFGRVVAAVFGVPDLMARWFAALCGRDRWLCFGAFDHARLVGTGAAYVADGYAWLGVATTLPDARGRGSQSAILAARIRAAKEAGAGILAVETSDRTAGVAGPSFRNVVRAGFEEAYRQQWWQPLQ